MRYSLPAVNGTPLDSFQLVQSLPLTGTAVIHASSAWSVSRSNTSPTGLEYLSVPASTFCLIRTSTFSKRPIPMSTAVPFIIDSPPCNRLFERTLVGVDIPTSGASVSYMNVTELIPSSNTSWTLEAVSEARDTITYCLSDVNVIPLTTQLDPLRPAGNQPGHGPLKSLSDGQVRHTSPAPICCTDTHTVLTPTPKSDEEPVMTKGSPLSTPLAGTVISVSGGAESYMN